MPRGSYLSDFEKEKISAYLKNGLSFREIATKINRSHVVVTNFANNPSNYGKNKTGGSKQKLSEGEKLQIINCASNTMKSLSQIIEECQVNVSKSTVSRLLKDSHSMKAVSSLPMLSHSPSPTILAPANSHTKAIRQVQSRNRNSTLNYSGSAGLEASPVVLRRQRHVSIYDIKRNFFGYQMQMMTPMFTIPAYIKSKISTNTDDIISTQLERSTNKQIAKPYTASNKPIKRLDSPFFTTPHLKCLQFNEETILPDVGNSQPNPTPPQHIKIKKEDIEDCFG